ncbi:MAG TPA: tetratricopeptide repeat protein, partial [Elusimicrobiota bacterium]|nr:tetratricopeptide repeat protein [Elusimicrobiota bacterium]
LHPLRVESVTWASERSDVLCAAFALGTALAWISGSPGRAVLLHALGLASKGTNVAVPLALAALDALGVAGRDRPRGRKAGTALAAMLALSAADGLLNVSLQRGAGAAADVGHFGLLQRVAIGLFSYTHGAAKTVWPSGLEGLYPVPKPFDPSSPRFLLASLAFVALTEAAWRLRKKAPAAAGAWAAYLLLMAPTAGFFKVGSQLTADRYTYLPALGFAGLAGEGLRRVPPRARRLAAAAALAALALLAGLTWRRQGDYLDADRFWSAMVETDPDNAAARVDLALRRIKEGRARDAEALLLEALAVDPSLGGARNDLGSLLVDEGKPEQALEQFRAAIALHPEHPVARYNMAVALLRLGRREEAAAALREELALIRARPAEPLRDSFEARGDERRTQALLDSLAKKR